jgi:hypothetical protein
MSKTAPGYLLLIFCGFYGLPGWAQVIDQTSPAGFERFIARLPEIRVSHEVHTKGGYVAPAKTKLYDVELGTVSEAHGALDYVASPEISKTFIPRMGVAWERFSFGHSAALPIPNTLQTTSGVLGFDASLSDDLLLRIEAKPGVYSDFKDVSSDDVNAPFILGVSWLIDSDLQIFGGVSVDFFREFPVLPGIGIRWEFAPDWTLLFILPEPKLVYRVDDHWEVFVGGDFKGTNVRVSQSFGTAVGRPNLNNAVLSLTEIRAGPGVIYKLNDMVSFQLEGGYMLHREWDFYRAGVKLKSEPAPYGQLSLNASF